jgi:protein phosphatase
MPVLVLPLEAWGATDKGHEREGNGVGGAKAGSQASRWTIRVAVEQYYDMPGLDLGTDLRTAVEVANNSLYQYLQSTGMQGAGSTMAAAVISESTLYVANVGDSRVYLLRNGQITQLTRDHTLTQRKIDQGLIRLEQADTDPDRSVLTRSLGAGPMVQADLFPPLQLTPGDVVLVCSDGLTDMLADAEIARIAGGSAPKRAAQRLIVAANKRGGFDNISVAIARVGGKKTSPAGGGLLESIGRLPRRQKTILLVGAILVAAALCALATMGWRMYGAGRSTPTPTPVPTATVETVPTATVPAVVPTTLQPTDTVSPGHPTSTPRPTNTPTNTPRPPTLTLTPVPPTHTPVPPTQPPGPGPGPKPTKPPDTPPPR